MWQCSQRQAAAKKKRRKYQHVNTKNDKMLKKKETETDFRARLFFFKCLGASWSWQENQANIMRTHAIHVHSFNVIVNSIRTCSKYLHSTRYFCSRIGCRTLSSSRGCEPWRDDNCARLYARCLFIFSGYFIAIEVQFPIRCQLVVTHCHNFVEFRQTWCIHRQGEAAATKSTKQNTNALIREFRARNK